MEEDPVFEEAGENVNVIVSPVFVGRGWLRVDDCSLENDKVSVEVVDRRLVWESFVAVSDCDMESEAVN